MSVDQGTSTEAPAPGSEATPPAAPTGEPAPPTQEAGGGEPQGGEEDDWGVEVPEGEYVPRGIINEARNRYTNERQKRLDYERNLEEWGGMDAVREAVELQKHLQSEEGVIDVFIEAGRSLGLGVRELEALFDQATGARPQQGDGAGEIDEDQLLTMKEARELFERELAQRDQRFEQSQLETQTTIARRTVADVLSQLGVESPEDAQTILQLGDRYLTEGSLDPDEVANAVRRGHADFLNIVEKRSQEYLQKKAGQASSVPKTPAGGAAPAAPAPEPPKSVDEAKARVREKMKAMMSG